MGHGNSNKLYITHAEHAGYFGNHSSSKGFQPKAESGHPGARQPYDCCALSFQPFSHPVCARNEDGTGTVFDLVNIIPWLKQHENTHPITKEPLVPSDLITLHYSRKEKTNEIHDPISFKPFSEHSHVVAIATTGNVFLADSIKGGRDLVADVPFKKLDVITLQNPHGLPPASVASASSSKTVAAPSAAVTKPATSAAVAAVKAKEAVPWNVSPYSNGLPGASLTSTSVDPQSAGAANKLVWDEEELMFESLSTLPKGKSKEKDVGKKRAYVRLVTSLGGSLNLELFCEKAPKTCYNFLMLAREGKYDGCLFHRLVPGFMIQTGDPTGTGSGGSSYWDTPFRDEYDLKGAAKHDARGVLGMANKGAGSNGSQFYVTFKATPHLDNKHTVFGKLVGGEDVLDALENLPRKDGTERPSRTVRIVEVVIYQDPFEEYKTRLANKLAKRALSDQSHNPHLPGQQPRIKTKEKGDEINWFGVKVGAEGPSATPGAGLPAGVGVGGAGGAGVGKYLQLAQPTGQSQPKAQAPTAPPKFTQTPAQTLKRGSGAVDPGEAKKRKTTGFGDFAGW